MKNKIFVSDYYQKVFACKTYKISLSAGCTCPNRDGSKGRGGCIFCSNEGSGDFAQDKNIPIALQIEKAKQKVLSKVRGRSGQRPGKFIAYFQSFSSTYGDSQELLKKYREALSCPDIAGLALASRPDCFDEKILEGLAPLAKETFLQIELGLQTSNEESGKLINRCYSNSDYLTALKKIREINKNIHIVTHLIFGLPGENRDDMLNSVRFVAEANQGYEFGIKITSLYVLENTKLAQMYKSGNYTPLKQEDYFELIKEALALLPPDCIIHRLTGDPPKALLLAPDWTKDKKQMLNEIKKILN